MRELLELVGDQDLTCVRDALAVLSTAAARLANTERPSSPGPSAPTRKDPA